MAAALSHRGGGPAQFFDCNGGTIGCRQLSRKGLSDNGFSFVSKNGVIQIVLDGFITNAGLLRAEIESRGHRLGSGSDAELLASLYHEYGVGFVERLRGPFAAAIWDSRRRHLMLARDHLGHKPVFFSESGNGFYFASEPKAFRAAGVVPFVADMESLTHFLSMRFVPAPHSLLKGVSKLAPAHYLIRQKGVSNVKRFWAPSFSVKLELPPADMIDGLEFKVRETVAAYIRKDYNTGCFLSGGLDSGLLVANMAHILKAPFNTFSLGVENESDEVPLARMVSEKFGTVQHELYPRDDIVRDLPAMIWHADEPSDMLAITKYITARMAAPHVDAVISGDGGDELFAGFPRFLGVRDAQYFSLIPAAIRNGFIASLTRRFGGRLGLHSIAGKILWLTEVARAGTLAECYAEAVGYLRFRKQGKQSLFTEDVWRQVSDICSNQLLIDIVAESDAEDPIEKLLYAELLTRLPEQLLLLNDRTGSAHGVDVLCPLADKELVEYAATIPANMKVRGRKAKYIERKMAERVLPRKVASFHKTGWSYPFAELCAGPLQPFLRSVFSDSRLVEDGIFRQETINGLVAEHGSRVANHHMRIWMLLSLEIWYRMASAGLHYEDMSPWMESHLRA